MEHKGEGNIVKKVETSKVVTIKSLNSNKTVKNRLLTFGFISSRTIILFKNNMYLLGA